MVMYRTSQQQMNDVMGFGMSLMFMGVMLGLVRSLMIGSLESEERPRLLTQTERKPLPGEERQLRRLRWFVINRQTGKTALLIYQRGDSWEVFSFKTRQYTLMPVRSGRIQSDIASFLTRMGYPGDRYQIVTEPPAPSEVAPGKSLLPQVMIEGGELVPIEYRYLTGWLQGALPEYSLLTVLPAVEVERKIDAVLKQLQGGVETIQQSDRFRLFLSTMAKFHRYSIGNQILIMLQKSAATHVAGFNTWKDLGRWVRSGEKGIAILAPVLPPAATCPKCEARLPKGAQFCPKCGAEVEVTEEIEVSPRYFKVVYVFDISQTEGKPLPEFEVPVLTGEVNEELFAKVMALANGQGLTVSFESRPNQNPEIKGEYFGKSIWVRPEESRAQQLKTLLHEVAHYFSEGVFMIPRRDAETIAESAAFAVGAHFGFDTGVRSFPYVAFWAQDKKVLEQNLGSIRRVATRMIDGIEG